MILLWTSIASILLIFLIKWIKKCSEPFRKFKTPPKWPFFEHLFDFITPISQVNSFHTSRKLFKLFQQYETPFRISIGPVPLGFNIICLDHPEDVKIVLHSMDCLKKPFLYKFLGLPVGLFQAEVEEWKIHRKHIAPSFSHNVLAKYEEVFNRKARRLVHELGKFATTRVEVNVFETIIKGTIDTLFTTTSGLELSFYSEEGEKIVNVIEEIMESILNRMVTPWYYPEFLYRFTIEGRKDQKNRKFMYEYMDMQIRHMLNSKTEFEGTLFTMEKAFKWIEEDKHNFNWKILQEHAMELLAAAADTTSITISFVLLMVAMYPEIQRKAQKEIDDIMGNQKNFFLDIDCLEKFSYVDRLIKETMRLFPGAPLILRETTKEVRLREDLVPKGAILLINFASMHRREDIWGPTVNQFDPDRFLPENIAKIHPYCFRPFSSGPRNCIGLNYAKISLKVYIIHLLRHFWFETDLKFEEIELSLSLTLQCLQKFPIRLNKRKM